MYTYRNFENKTVNNEIDQLNRSKRYHELRMERIHKNMKDGKFLQKAIADGNQHISDIDSQINQLNLKLEAIRNGDLDQELKEKYTTISETISRSANDKSKKRYTHKQEDKVFIKQAAKRGKLERKQDNFEKFSVDNEYRNYMRRLDRVPKWIDAKLAKMPNNRGYIWNGIHMYGKLPYRENDDRTMIEMQKGYTLIHVRNDNGYQVIRKDRR